MQAFADEFRRDVVLVECEGKRRREEEEEEEEMMMMMAEDDESLAWELQVAEENGYAEQKLKKRMKRLRDAGLGRRAARERAMSEYEQDAGMDLPLSPVASPTARSAVRKMLDAEAERKKRVAAVVVEKKKRKAMDKEYESTRLENGGEFLLQSVMDKVRRLRVGEGGVGGVEELVREAAGGTNRESLCVRRERVRRQLCICVE